MSSSSMSGRTRSTARCYSLKRGGRLVTCGSTSGQSTQINLFQLYLQQYRIIGSFGCRTE